MRALGAVALLLVVVLEQVATAGPLTDADQPVWRWFTHHRAPVVTDVFRGVTDVGSFWVVAPVVAVAAVLLFVTRHRALAALVVAAPIITSWLTDVTKGLVGRSRPPVPTRLVSASDAAFPSGHASSSIACYAVLAGVVWWISPPGWRRTTAAVVGALLVLAIGCSRLYLGVHWLTDVAGGWLLGVAVVLALVTATHARAARLDRVAAADRDPPHA